METSFKSWEWRRHLTPEADRVLPLIASAWQAGMTRGQIGNVVGLDRDILDQLLAGMVQVGVLTVAWEDGVPVYRCPLASSVVTPV